MSIGEVRTLRTLVRLPMSDARVLGRIAFFVEAEREHAPPRRRGGALMPGPMQDRAAEHDLRRGHIKRSTDAIYAIRG